MKNPESTIGNLIDHQTVAFLGSVDANGFPNIKAMLAPRRREGIRVLYFTTNVSARRTARFRDDARACVYFCDRRFFRGVMLTGTVEVLEDPYHKELIWQDGDEQYYPGGVTDPDYCVLRFTARSGRRYGNFKSEDFPVP